MQTFETLARLIARLTHDERFPDDTICDLADALSHYADEVGLSEVVKRVWEEEVGTEEELTRGIHLAIQRIGGRQRN